MRPLLLILLVPACNNDPAGLKDPPINVELPDSGTSGDTDADTDTDTDTTPSDDQDLDGYGAAEDCNDGDPTVNPGAVERCYDGVDQNCDAASDYDCDGDGHNSSAYSGDDCDDADASAYPDATELQDGLDQDCDGLVDEDLVAAGDLIVTELMPMPTAGSDGEWFEVQNLSGHDLNLVGWTVTATDGGSFTVADALVIAPGGAAVFGASDDYTVNGGAGVDYVWSNFALSSAGDDLVLAVDGVAMAGAVWDASWSFEAGHSLGLDPLWTDTAHVLLPTAWCTGSSRYGDGDYGTPGGPNDACTGVDHDGDGVSVADGDCDDAASSAYPGAPELWDDLDNDCDGSVDDLSTDAAIGWVEGAGADDLGYEDSVGTGDIDGDGLVDVVVGGRHVESSSTGGVYLLHGADLVSSPGDATTLAFATVLGDDYYNYAGAVSPHLGDADGDGLDDLLIGASDYFAGQYPLCTAGGWFSGANLTGDLVISDATTVFSAATFTETWIVSDLDVDGDGLSDAVYTDPFGTSDQTSQGMVYVFSAGTLTAGGSMALTDADQVIVGEDNYDYLGYSASAGDTDGDGYDEILLGSFGSDLGVNEGGALYLVSGGSWTSGSVADVERAVITGYASDSHIANSTPSLVTDLDGDGAADLALSARLVGKAWVFLDAGALSGQVSALDATCELDGGAEDYFGTGLTAGDLDGDGLLELAVGAGDTYNTDLPPDQSGMVYVWSGDSFANGPLDSVSARWSFTGGIDGFGFLVHAADLTGDGRDELLVDAPMYDTNRNGRLWVFGR